ncbi:site-specific integrase [Sinomonas gamaensis]|uniref:site-specific integrase n=1 Tax=Sinomonas gamaensis TaxID=2565624 RepID=UPI00110917EA|nr:site-specific integrase [Sinomonas gamaensis]
MAVIDKWKAKGEDGVLRLLPKSEQKGLRWRADWTDAEGKRRRKDFATKQEAQEYEAEMVRQARRGVHVDLRAGQKRTVAQLHVEFIERMEKHGVRGNRPASPRTLDNYRRNYEGYIEPRWGMTPLAGVTYDATASWIAELQGKPKRDGTVGPAGQATRHAVAGAFSRLMNYAVKLKYLPSNPTKDATGATDYVPSAKPQRKHVYLSMPQLLLLASKAGEFEDLILLAGLCGLRWGELAALRVEDVTLGGQPHVLVRRSMSELPRAQGGLVEKSTKNGEERMVPMPRTLAMRLAGRLRDKPSDARVFTGARGAVLRNSTFTRRFYAPAIEEAAAAASGFPRPTMHDLRHTAVSLAIRSGANVKVVQQIAGHSSATLTLDTYAGLFTDDLHDSAARLDAAMSATLKSSSSLSRHWTPRLPSDYKDLTSPS